MNCKMIVVRSFRAATITRKLTLDFLSLTAGAIILLLTFQERKKEPPALTWSMILFLAIWKNRSSTAKLILIPALI